MATKKPATKKKPTAAAGPSKPSKKLADAIDRELAAQGLAKRKAGKRPTREELRAIIRLERAKEEVDRWRFYSTIPKRHWQEMSGRQNKVLNSQASAYGMPISGRVIDLRALAKWLHDFLASNARKLAALSTGDPLLDGESTPALERYRNARAILAEMDIEERSGQLIRRDVAHDNLMLIASLLRGAGVVLQRQFGDEAHTILDEALDEAERVIEREFAFLEEKENASAKSSDKTDGK